MQTTCLLCGCELTLDPDDDRFQIHPERDDCLVRLTDRWGVATERPAPLGVLDAEALDDEGFDIGSFPHVDVVLPEIFASFGLSRVGGQSTGRGWSSVSLFQKCPYAWRRRYIEDAKPFLNVENEGRAVGTIVHTHLALHYANMVDALRVVSSDGSTEITPKLVHDRLLHQANPKFVHEGWRLYTAYRLFYEYEEILPLAIEYDLRDPRSFDSCRYDLIAYFAQPIGSRPPGTYVIEHKTAQRFDRATLEGWPNDGEVIGQVSLWNELGMDHRFGKLEGVIVNILGKQKDPEMHRTIVAPSTWQIDQHRHDLKRWAGLMHLARQYDEYPRARNSCVSRYGMCEWFDHCASGE